MTIKYYWEDFEVGQVRDMGTVTPTREETIAFARQFDPQPFHVDPEAAQRSFFGGLIASGLHTLVTGYRMLFQAGYVAPDASLGSPGIDELRWPRPVRAGDLPRWQTLAGMGGAVFVLIQAHVVPSIGVAVFSVGMIAWIMS